MANTSDFLFRSLLSFIRSRVQIHLQELWVGSGFMLVFVYFILINKKNLSI